MSTITNVTTNLYNSLKDSAGSNAPQQTGNAPVATVNGAGSGTSSANSSYLLSLSEEAKSYLNTGNTSSSVQALDENFILTTRQQQQIADVLAKYKDEPFTKEVYDQIDEELDKLGLSADALAIKDKARGVNTTGMLLAALNGTGGDLSQNLLTDSTASAEKSQTKKDNYVKALLTEWSEISTTIGSAE